MEGLIAVFGGSFSPVTNAHLAIAEQITNLYDIEKVIFLPIDSLRRLRKQYPDHPMAFVIGSDNLRLIDTWNDFQELMEDYYFIVIPRNGDNPQTMIRKNPSLLANLESFLIPEGYIRNDGNSTHVRDLLKVGKSVRYLVPEPTYFYLENHLKGWGFNA